VRKEKIKDNLKPEDDYYYSFCAPRYSVPEGEILKTHHVNHSSINSVVKALWKETALPRCKATDNLFFFVEVLYNMCLLSIPCLGKRLFSSAF